jgi:hypothetical protein
MNQNRGNGPFSQKKPEHAKKSENRFNGSINFYSKGKRPVKIQRLLPTYAPGAESRKNHLERQQISGLKG